MKYLQGMQKNIIMETKQALEIVLELAQLGAEKENGYVNDERAEANYEAIAEVKDYKRDLIRD